MFCYDDLMGHYSHAQTSLQFYKEHDNLSCTNYYIKRASYQIRLVLMYRTCLLDLSLEKLYVSSYSIHIHLDVDVSMQHNRYELLGVGSDLMPIFYYNSLSY